ncbi:DUF1850 domain-containing protein [Thermovenabulum gondwanense]|uniref:DUF1850 domain-containing protein n=1 Tax=Thermovenabulum gondwanense TaxID=520767 RepID=A0A162M5S1_9FIRM|nr:DUF1850 domain-containing protein [Thermovenabulum gondwanense]KYO64134.1 hypothetical protein ATZ99_21650 [Thermovenabulum gondwanense]
MKKRIDIFFFFLVLVIAVFFSFYRVEKKVILTVYNADNGKTIEIPLQNNEFTHVFIHSIQKTPVYEDFKVEDNKKLHLIRTRYFSLGIGLPYAEEGKFENQNGEFVMEMNRFFDTLPIRVSPLKGHGIIANGIMYNFLDFSSPNDLIIISAKVRWIIKNIKGGS